MTARESQAKDRITLADLIFLKEGIHVCIVCCNEKGLRKLTCGHLECLTCLGKVFILKYFSSRSTDIVSFSFALST